LPGGHVIGYSYDSSGNLLSLTPPGHGPYTFAYGVDHQLTGVTPPSATGGGTGPPTTYAYDSVGRLAQMTQADGRTIALAYDPQGRPVSLTEARGTVGVTYDGASGNILTVTSPDAITLSSSYDGMLQAGSTWSGPIAGSVIRTFDNNLRPLTRTVSGVSVSLQYDLDSYLTAIGALTLSRDPATGQVVGTTLGGVTDSSSYTVFGGLDQYTAGFNSSTGIYAAQYVRDGLGRIVRRTETVNGIATVSDYSYDASGRLATVAVNGVPSQAYTYDNNGNRISTGPPGASIAASYDGQDRLVQQGSTTYAFSANGEVQSKIVAGQTTSYTYDTLGDLIGVTLPSGQQVTYLYDGLSERMGEKVDGVLTRGWLYDERGRVVAELDGTGAVTSRFVYASRGNLPSYLVRGGSTYRVISDDQGSPRLVVNTADGTIAQQNDYDAYGNVTGETTQSGFSPIPFGFAGGLYDRDTGLVRFGARDYDPEVGRWTTRDPIWFANGEANLYTYASNDPVNRLDSNGLDDTPGGGVCIGPMPLPGYEQGPIFLDPHPLPPVPPLCPTCAIPKDPKASGKTDNSGGGPLSFGPFTFSPKVGWPSLSDIRNKDPKDWFGSFKLDIEAPIYPDFSLPPTPLTPGGPDPASPYTPPPAPQCQPNLGDPDPLGCEA